VNEIDLMICESQETKALTLACLEKMKAQDEHELNVVIFGFIGMTLFTIILGLFIAWIIDG